MATQAAPLPGQITSLKPAAQDAARTPLTMAFERFRRNRLSVGGGIVVLFFVFVALTAGIFAPFDPNHQTMEAQDVAPGTYNAQAGKVNLLGSDDLGRDILSRLMYGARVSLSVGIIAETVTLLIGVPLGLLAGFFGGRLDNLIMRATDIMYAFPDLLLVIILVVTFGRSIWVVFVALGVTGWPTMTRLVRGQVLQVKQMDYVLGARSIGARSLGLMARHVLPNILGPIIVLATLGIPGTIIAEATLTYLGLGVNPSTPTWGTMVNAAYPGITSHTTEVIIPALAIGVLTLAITFVGDGVRDAFDPRTK